MKITWLVLTGARKYWLQYSLGFIGLAIATVAGFYLPWALRTLTQLAMEGTASFAAEALTIGLLLLGATTLQAIGTSLSGYMNHYTALHCVADLRTRLYRKYQQMSLRYFNRSRTGDLTGRVVNDAMEAEIFIAHVIPEFVVNGLTFVGVGILLLTINVKLALISLITIPILLAITVWQSRFLAPLWGENSKARGEISGKVQENLSGMKEIQIFNRQEEEQRRVHHLALKHTKTYLRASKYYETSVPLLAFVTALGTVFVVIFGGRLVSTGEVTIADIVGFIAYLGMFYGPVKSFSGLVEMAGRAAAGLRRVYEVLDEEEDVKEKRHASTLPRVQGQITFQQVTFSHQDGSPILEKLNLTIEPGRTVALVGTTGVGKTTLVSLVNRFYDPQEGSILMDGTDIRDVTLHSLRNNISMVLQDTFLFDGSVYDNIAYGWQDASREAVLAAAKAAKAHDFIVQMEQGYDTIIGERGVRLSGGQKQRLSIARAILRNAPVLILDEATSALDTKTEQEIQQALDEISKDRTTLVIAHRLSTIRHADLIVVLEGTGIAEMGTHEELLQRSGTYAKLYSAQAS
ncbi:ABC transporter ATP-binding protein [Paenibacillus sp. SYP-B4298]|uniref:ABC transporter ATP-binding protein n=1 Tax=Paenibacillus sp. SYP-B4298 TaxID=2996034 RepID=UPI0022DD19E0|nr:ABC transporter ATP-binding protein [Paenibacillus sp. SYP-B4298]